MPTRQERLFAELEAKYGPRIAQAFADAIEDLRSAADVQRVVTALQAGDVEGAVSALNLDPVAFDELQEVIRQTYRAGGQGATELFPPRDQNGARLIVRFNGRNVRAESWINNHSSRLITGIVDDQRRAARDFLREGLERGDNPRTTALDLVGRVDRASGERTGGIIGLTSQQEGYVTNARAQLESGDPAQLRAFLGREARDKRFDRSIEKAIRDGEPVSPETVRKSLKAYESRLLKIRGDTIGRTETLTSLNAAKHESYKQAIENGTITENQVRKVWRSAGDFRVRHSHRAMNGDSVGLNEAFTSPTGARLLYPGDTSLGAGPGEIINCRCVAEYRVDFFANVRAAA